MTGKYLKCHSGLIKRNPFECIKTFGTMAAGGVTEFRLFYKHKGKVVPCTECFFFGCRYGRPLARAVLKTSMPQASINGATLSRRQRRVSWGDLLPRIHRVPPSGIPSARCATFSLLKKWTMKPPTSHRSSPRSIPGSIMGVTPVPCGVDVQSPRRQYPADLLRQELQLCGGKGHAVEHVGETSVKRGVVKGEWSPDIVHQRRNRLPEAQLLRFLGDGCNTPAL